MRLDEIFDIKDLPPHVRIKPDGYWGYSMEVDSPSEGTLDYEITFRTINGFKDLVDVNFYLNRDGVSTQMIVPTGAGLSVLSGVAWAVKAWIREQGGRVAIHGWAEEAKRARVYARLFAAIARELGTKGPGGWTVLTDGHNAFVLARLSHAKRLLPMLGEHWRRL